MHEAYLEINGVRTKISTWGKWVEESFQDSEDIVILVTGNPGINGFYQLFAKKVHEKLGYPVWCIGHAGHDLPEESVNLLPKVQYCEELYGVKKQIQHKVDFFEKYLPKNARVHLIGHSIGSYMILELMDYLKDKVSDVYLLFPAIEHMADTSNGKFMLNWIQPIVWLTIFLSWIFTLLPNIIQNLLIRGYTITVGVDYGLHINNIRALIKPKVLQQVFFLAFEEMEQVKERNTEAIKKHANKIKFYYGKDDGWAPGSFCDRLKKDVPTVNAQISNHDHAFVLRQSVEIANIVSDWIKAKQ